jgi:hypothetical protein
VASTTITAGTAFAGVISAQSATSRTDQHFEGATLVVTAESLLGGVDIGGGALHIDAIRSLATAKVDGGKVSAATAQTTVTGATVAGQPVSIDSTGVHVAGNGDNGAVTKQVNAALAQLAARGISLRSLDATKLVKHGVAKASTGGLLLGFDENVNLPVSLPALPVQPPGLNGDYFGSVALAGAGVDAFASPAVPLGGVTAPLPQVSAPGATGGAPSAGGGPLPVAPTTTTTGPTGPAPTVVAPARHNAALLGVDVTNKRLETLALVLLAYPLALLLGRPLRAPSRLPGGE